MIGEGEGAADGEGEDEEEDDGAADDEAEDDEPEEGEDEEARGKGGTFRSVRTSRRCWATVKTPIGFVTRPETTG